MQKRVVVVAAVAALFVAAGGAAAAGQFTITSTSQIKPSVIHALRGNQGPRGLRGLTGLQGATGPRGSYAKKCPPGTMRCVNGPDPCSRHAAISAGVTRASFNPPNTLIGQASGASGK